MSRPWPVGPARPPTLGSDVHVWRIDLTDGDATTGALPHDERERAECMRPVVRERWVAARLALRRLLGAYLDEEPTRVVLQLGERGKPRLRDGSIPLRFNLSHSGELALVALALEREVGIDIERIDPSRDVERLAEIGLSAGEAEAVRTAPPARRIGAFHQAWARREAIAKCHGAGLGAPLPSGPVAVASVDVDADHTAAIALAGTEMAPLRLFATG